MEKDESLNLLEKFDLPDLPPPSDLVIPGNFRVSIYTEADMRQYAAYCVEMDRQKAGKKVAVLLKPKSGD